MKRFGGNSRRLLVIAAIAAPLAVAAACSSTKDFTAPDADSGTIDDDGGSDAYVAPDVAVPTWCQTHQPTAFFCADFDEGNEKLAYTSGKLKPAIDVLVTDAGTNALVPSSDSPPSGLAFTMVPSAGDGGSQGSFINGQSSGSHSSFYAFDVDFRIDALGANAATATVALGSVLISVGQTYTYFGFDLSAGNIRLATGAGLTAEPVETLLGPAPAIGTWTHVSITVAVGSEIVVTAQLAIDTPVTASVPNPFATGSIFYAGTTLGIDSLGQTGAAGVTFDNLTLTTIGPDAGAGDGG